MDIFQYVASNDPDASIAIINKYGYSVQDARSSDDVGYCLKQLVASEGEPAMKDVYAIHPDKEQIIELYGAKADKDGCGCKGAAAKSSDKVQSFMNSITNNSNTQIQLCIIAAAILLGAAILSKN
jgi:hypothetical protein